MAYKWIWNVCHARLNACGPAPGTVSRGSENFRRWGLVGGSRSLWVGHWRLYAGSLVPAWLSTFWPAIIWTASTTHLHPISNQTINFITLPSLSCHEGLNPLILWTQISLPSTGLFLSGIVGTVAPRNCSFPSLGTHKKGVCLCSVKSHKSGSSF